jgi:hypothetical protein
MIAKLKCRYIFVAILLLTISLLPLISNAQALPGYYRTKAGGCNLSIRITQAGKQYLYTLKVNGHTKTGKLKTTTADESGGIGVIFTGTKWNEYPTKHKPGGVEGVWIAGVITIQNYGNSMNNYMQLAACGEKYIELTRQ